MTKDSIVTLIPGQVPLAIWRDIYFGAQPVLDAACRPKGR